MNEADNSLEVFSTNPGLSSQERSFLHANQQELKHISQNTEIPGSILDNKRVLEGTHKDFLNIIGKGATGLLLMVFFLTCVTVYSDLNWYPYRITSTGAAEHTLLIFSDKTSGDDHTTTSQTKQSTINEQRTDTKISASGLIGSNADLLDPYHANRILVKNNDPVPLLPTTNSIDKIESILIKQNNNYVKYLVIISDLNSMSPSQSPSRVCKTTAHINLNSSTEFAIKCRIIFDSTQAENDLVDNGENSNLPPIIHTLNSIFKNDPQFSARR